METTGTMLLGTETPAALTVLRGLRVDGVGLNCATGPAEMGEHLRHLSRHADMGLSVMPNAGLPVLSKGGAHYPLSPSELADAHEAFTSELGFALVGGCCGTTPGARRRGRRPGRRAPARAARRPRPEPGVASLYTHVPFRQDVSYLSIGERTNANGSKAFKEAMLEARWDDLVDIARGQTRDGAHLIDVCVDYVGRDGVEDVEEVVGRLATASTLPLVIDSTEPEVVERGLELCGRAQHRQQRELRGRRRARQPVRPRHARRRRARRGGRRPHHRRDRPGPHRRAQGRHRRAAHRRPHRATGGCARRTSSSTP